MTGQDDGMADKLNRAEAKLGKAFNEAERKLKEHFERTKPGVEPIKDADKKGKRQ